MIVFWLRLEMMFWQDVSSFTFNNRNLSSWQTPKKGFLISSVSLNYSNEGLYYLMKNYQNQERLFLGYMKVSIFSGRFTEKHGFSNKCSNVNWLMFRGVEPGPHEADYPYSSYFPNENYVNDGIHTSYCGHGVLSLAPAENARKLQFCHQFKGNAHSSGARHCHKSDAVPDWSVYESTGSDKISWYSRVE